MKKILIAFAVLMVCVGGVLAYAAFNANALIESYKPEMEQIASDLVGSPVSLGAIKVSIFPRAKLLVDDVRVGGTDPSSEGLSLGSLSLRIKLLPLLKRTLTITALILTDPSITAIYDEEGIHIAGLPKSVSPETEDAPDAEETDDAPDSSASIPINIDLQTFELRNGTVVFRDDIANVEYTLTDLSVRSSMTVADDTLELTSLSGGGTALSNIDFSFQGDGLAYALDSGTIRLNNFEAESLGNSVTISGSVNPDDPEQRITIVSSGIALASLRPLYEFFAPDVLEMQLEGSIRPDIQVSLAPEGAYTATGTIELDNIAATLVEFRLAELSGTVHLEADPDTQRLHGEGITGSFNGAPMNVKFDTRIDNGEEITETMRVSIFSGNADLNTTLTLTDEAPFTLSMNVEGVEAKEVIQAMIPDVDMHLSGTVHKVSSEIQGRLDDTMMSSLAGNAKLDFRDGVLEDINLGAKVLGAVDSIPFVRGALLSLVPDAMSALVLGDDTILSRVSGTFDIANETLTTNDMYIESTYFALDTRGTIGFDTELDLKSTIYFSPEFSASLAQGTPELSVLFDEQGRLAFPVTISGLPPKLLVVPDLSALLKGAIKNTVKNEIKGVLQGILSGGDSSDDESGEAKPRKSLRDRLPF
ncbi:MAG: AsmA family protein [Candidatus Hydrogenedentes bacterium]|nr:AsmA family protein [Candidatus Hydrogenedentota bacterium]